MYVEGNHIITAIARYITYPRENSLDIKEHFLKLIDASKYFHDNTWILWIKSGRGSRVVV